MNNNRQAALDLSRFVAAMVVFLGHLFFLPQTYSWSHDTINKLSFIRVGDTAVLFFFALSGYVLTIRSDSQRYFDWLKRRLTRLYPVYFFAWIFGLALVILHDKSLLNLKVLALGLIGFQSVDPEINLVINAPLWSLSIEILGAFFLYFVLKLRKWPYVLVILLVVSIVAWSFEASSPVFRAAPYLIVGVLLRCDYFKNHGISTLKASLLSILLIGYFSFFGAKQILDLSASITGELAKLFIVAFALFLVSNIELRGRITEIAIGLGKRSFCIYAFHYPILLIFNYFIQPSTNTQMYLYLLMCTICTMVISELTFKFIDVPATKWSKK